MKDAASSAKPRKIQRKGLPEPRVKSPYEEAYPTFSARIPRALYDRAKNLKAVTGKTFATILEESLDRQEAATAAAYNRGHAAAVEEFAVPFRCCVCGKQLYLNHPDGFAVVADYLTASGWGHAVCTEGR